MGRWLITSAWPYVNYMIHLGNLIGSLLSADVFARYLRLKGEEVLFVTGSDQHGTPIEVEALKRGISPESLAMENHEKLVKILKQFKISTDNYTYTHNPIHQQFVREFYKKIYDNGYIFVREEETLYCEKDKIFLPDRFVVGTCPFCGYERANGDQCENCKRLLTPIELLDPKCAICGSTPVIRKTKNWYFDLPKFSEKLRELLEKLEGVTENARKFSLQMIESGLTPRSLTRDNKWGIPAPFPEAEGKTIYVWMEAVLGYISAVIEYFKRKGQEEKWRDYWFNKDTKIAFFIGKDNIPFHTIIFPALLMATEEDYCLNFYVAATEFLMFEGQKFSKSKRVGIWLDEALELLPSDYWRYALLLIRPEVRDTNFTWSFLEGAINNDLNNQLGNLVLRVLTLLKRYFNCEIPRPERVVEEDRRLLEKMNETKQEVEKYFGELRIQRALVAVMDLVRESNALLNLREPWKTIKENIEDAKSTVYVVARVLKGIAIMLYPFIPDASEKIIEYLGIEPKEVTWDDITKDFPEDARVSEEFKQLFNKIEIKKLQAKLEEIRKR